MNPSLKVFVDTSAWADLYLRDLANHTVMEDYYKRLIAFRRQLFTSNYVLTELVALLTSPGRVPRVEIVRYVNTIKRIPWLHIVHVDSSLDAEAWRLLEQRLDKNWSLVDASSFVIMTREGIGDAFTNDHHFEQAGFMRVPST